MNNTTTPIPCMGCQKQLNMPSSLVRMVEKRGKAYVAFCSRDCNNRFIRLEGRRQQNKKLREMLKRFEEENSEVLD